MARELRKCVTEKLKIRVGQRTVRVLYLISYVFSKSLSQQIALTDVAPPLAFNQVLNGLVGGRIATVLSFGLKLPLSLVGVTLYYCFVRELVGCCLLVESNFWKIY